MEGLRVFHKIGRQGEVYVRVVTKDAYVLTVHRPFFGMGRELARGELFDGGEEFIQMTLESGFVEVLP